MNSVYFIKEADIRRRHLSVPADRTYVQSMTQLVPPAPETGAPLKGTDPSEFVRDFLALRRSSGKLCLEGPGPTAAQLEDLLRVAVRVPDHRRVEPWRFVVIEGAAREQLSEEIAGIAAARDDLTPAEQAQAGGLLRRAPVVISVVSSPDAGHKTPVWEQELSTGALCYNVLLAARAAGFGAAWLTEWIAYDRAVAERLGLASGERIAGFIYVGTSTADAPERPRPNLPEKITHWSG